MSEIKRDNKTVSGEQNENRIWGRQPVTEALRSERTVERVYVQDGSHDGPIETIKREAKKRGVTIRFVDKEILDRMSDNARHQGVIASVASYAYSDVSDILEAASLKGEEPFIFVLDGIGDPHNLGAIIRTANVCGAHGVIIPKNRSATLNATVVKASAGALNHTPVARVTNITSAIESLKKKGLWFVCADMDGDPMYDVDLSGPVGLVIGSEGNGVSHLVKEHCDLTASIPVLGEITSLNASVAAAVIAYEVVRRRMGN